MGHGVDVRLIRFCRPARLCVRNAKWKFNFHLNVTFNLFLSSLYSASFIHYQKTIKHFFFLEISLIFLYNFCLFPRHPTFFFFFNWHMIPKFFIFWFVFLLGEQWAACFNALSCSLIFLTFLRRDISNALFEETRTKKTMPRYKLLQDAFGTSDERRLNACVRTVHEENRWEPKEI